MIKNKKNSSLQINVVLRKKECLFILIGVLRKKIKILKFKDNFVIFIKKIVLIKNIDNNFKNVKGYK